MTTNTLMIIMMLINTTVIFFLGADLRSVCYTIALGFCLLYQLLPEKKI